MTVEKQLYVGDVWEVPATTIRTRTGLAVDPAGFTATAKRPDGSTFTVSPTKTATGVYYFLVTLTAPGTWHLTTVAPEGEDRGVETIERSVKEAPSL